MKKPIDSNYAQPFADAQMNGDARLTLAECLFSLVLAAAIVGCAVAVVLGASLLSALL